MADTRDDLEKSTKETARKINTMNKVSGGALGVSKPANEKKKSYIKKEPAIRTDSDNSPFKINKGPLVIPTKKVTTPVSQNLSSQ